MGWDTSCFPEDPDPELLCCICQGVLENAVVSPCEHVFCSKCAKEWLQKSATCPNCRQEMDEKDLKQVLPLVRNLISKLDIFCEHKEKGCEVVTTVDRLQQHLGQCRFAPEKRMTEPEEGQNWTKTISSNFKRLPKFRSKIKHCIFYVSYKKNVSLLIYLSLFLFFFLLFLIHFAECLVFVKYLLFSYLYLTLLY